MYSTLYKKPRPTKGESGSSKASGLTKMAKAISLFSADVPSTREGLCGRVSQSRILVREVDQRVSSSTGRVKPKAPKKEPESLV